MLERGHRPNALRVNRAVKGRELVGALCGNMRATGNNVVEPLSVIHLFSFKKLISWPAVIAVCCLNRGLDARDTILDQIEKNRR